MSLFIRKRKNQNHLTWRYFLAVAVTLLIDPSETDPSCKSKEVGESFKKLYGAKRWKQDYQKDGSSLQFILFDFFKSCKEKKLFAILLKFLFWR